MELEKLKTLTSVFYTVKCGNVDNSFSPNKNTFLKSCIAPRNISNIIEGEKKVNIVNVTVISDDSKDERWKKIKILGMTLYLEVDIPI